MSPAVPVPPRPHRRRAPLSYAQRAIWRAEQVNPGTALHNETAAFRLHGPVDPGALERALAALAARHEVMRCGVAAGIGAEGEPWQFFADGPAPRVERVDLTAVPGPDRERELAEAVARAAATPFDLSRPPLMRTHLFRLGDERHLLLFTAHHIVVDAWAFGVFLEDLAARYAEEAAGTAPAGTAPAGRLGRGDGEYGSPGHESAEYGSGGHADDRHRGTAPAGRLGRGSTGHAGAAVGAERPAGPGFGDYAAWQRTDPDVGRGLGHWRKRLGGELPSVRLPADAPHSTPHDAPAAAGTAPAEVAGALHHFTVPAALAARLAERGRAELASLPAVLLTAYGAVVQRYTGQDDLVIGMPVATRNRPALSGTVGPLLNLVAHRMDLSGEPAFREALGRTRKRLKDDLKHRDTPFDLVVEELGAAVPVGRSPLLRLLFSFHSGPAATLRFPGVAAVPAPSHSGTAKYDLSLFLRPRPSGDLDASLEYRTALLSPGTVAGIADALLHVLEAVAEDPGRLLADLPLLAGAERRRIVTGFNDAARERPPWRTVPQALRTLAARDGRAPAIGSGGEPGEESGGRTLTRAEAEEAANRVAGRLAAGFGVRSGDRVALLAERGPELVPLIVGLWRAGAVLVPLDAAMPPERAAHVLRDSGARLLVGDGPGGPDASGGPEGDPGAYGVPRAAVRELLAGPGPEDAPVPFPDGPEPDSLAYLMYTSGSTGMPKGVAVPHSCVANLLHSVVREPGIGTDDVLVAVTLLTFDISVLELFAPLVAGGQVVIAPRETVRDAGALGALLERSGATLMQATPSLWRGLLDGGWPGRPELRALSGGEALDAELAGRLLARCAEVWNLYGPTETTIWSTAGRVRPGEPVTVGRPLARTVCYVLDGRGRPVPVGAVGELVIGGAGVAAGYWNRPDLTAAAFVPDPVVPDGGTVYRTGDLARYLPDGRIAVLGRADQQVKILGHRIEPGEAETLLAAHPAVRAAAVVVDRAQPTAPRLVAFYVPAAPDTASGTALDTASGIAPGIALDTASGTALDTASGTAPGIALDTASGTALDTASGTALDTASGTALDTASGTASDTASGTAPADGTVPVTASDAAPADGTAGAVDRELRRYLRERLPAAAIPAVLSPLPELPLNTSGKVDRPALARTARGLRSVRERIAPATGTERAVVAEWAGLLGLPEHEIGTSDDFFAAGGNSITAARLLGRVRAALGHAPALAAFYADPTPAALARAADSAVRTDQEDRTDHAPAPGTGTAASAARPGPGDPLPLTDQQRQLWLAHRLAPEPAMYNLAAAVHLDGPVDPIALSGALRDLVTRHQVLAARCELADSGPVLARLPADSVRLAVADVPEAGPKAGPGDGPEQKPGEGGTPGAGERERWLADAAAAEAARPFDLETGPLVRLTLLRDGDRRSVLLCTAHHIAVDGWSIGVAVRELAVLYGRRTGAAGKPGELPPSAPDFPGYAAAAAEPAAVAVRTDHLAHWRRRLAGHPGVLPLPSDPDADGAPGVGAELPVELSAELTGRLRRTAARLRTTPFTVLLTVYAVLLGRYAGTDDVVVGVPAANRGEPRLEGLVGPLVNTLPVRLDLAGGAAAAELVARTGRVLAADLDRPLVPFDRLVADLGVPRDLGRPALVQATLVFQEAHPRRLRLGEVPGELRPVGTGAAKYDLTLALEEYPDRIGGALEYAGNRFTRASARRFAGQLRTLLCAVLDDPGRSPDAVDLSPEGVSPLPAEPAGAARGRYPGPVHELFRAQAARRPDAVAVRHAGQAVGYRQLDRWSEALAARLSARGAAPGRFVAVLLPTGPAQTAAVLAVARTGAAFAVLDSGDPAPRLRAVLDDSEPVCVLAAGECLAARPGLWDRAAGRFGGVPVEPMDTRVPARDEAPPSARPRPTRPGVPGGALQEAPAGGVPGRAAPQPVPEAAGEPVPPSVPVGPAAGSVPEAAGEPVSASSPQSALEPVPPSVPASVPAQPVPEAAGEPVSAPAAGTVPPSVPAEPVAGSGGDGALCLVYTSGSTGAPKGIALPHAAFAQFAHWQRDRFGIRPGSRIAQWAPFTYDAAYTEVFAALCAGATLCVPPDDTRRDPAALADWLRTERITQIQTVPGFAALLTEALDRAGRGLPDLEHLLLAGEVLPPSLAAAWADRADRPALHNLYGPTECVLATHRELAPGERFPATVPIGTPIPGREALVLDHRGRPCPAGVTGEIHLRSDFLAGSYHRRPEEDARAYVPDPWRPGGTLYRTGDLGRYLPGGELVFTGRAGGLVKIRGNRVELEEIEALLEAHPSVREAAAAVHGTGPDGRLLGYAVATDGVTGAALRAHLAERLPAAVVPEAVVLMDALPRTRTDKRDRDRLPAPQAPAPDTGEPPRGGTEQRVADAWRHVLGERPFGRHTNFFEAGGTSLLGARLQLELGRRLGREVRLVEIFARPTIAAFAAGLDTGPPSPAGPAAADGTAADSAALRGQRRRAAVRARGRARRGDRPPRAG